MNRDSLKNHYDHIVLMIVKSLIDNDSFVLGCVSLEAKSTMSFRESFKPSDFQYLEGFHFQIGVYAEQKDDSDFFSSFSQGIICRETSCFLELKLDQTTKQLQGQSDVSNYFCYEFYNPKKKPFIYLNKKGNSLVNKPVECQFLLAFNFVNFFT